MRKCYKQKVPSPFTSRSSRLKCISNRLENIVHLRSCRWRRNSIRTEDEPDRHWPCSETLLWISINDVIPCVKFTVCLCTDWEMMWAAIWGGTSKVRRTYTLNPERTDTPCRRRSNRSSPYNGSVSFHSYLLTLLFYSILFYIVIPMYRFVYG